MLNTRDRCRISISHHCQLGALLLSLGGCDLIAGTRILPSAATDAGPEIGADVRKSDGRQRPEDGESKSAGAMQADETGEPTGSDSMPGEQAVGAQGPQGADEPEQQGAMDGAPPDAERSTVSPMPDDDPAESAAPLDDEPSDGQPAGQSSNEPDTADSDTDVQASDDTPASLGGKVANCGNFIACGGEIAGEWQVDGLCSDPARIIVQAVAPFGNIGDCGYEVFDLVGTIGGTITVDERGTVVASDGRFAFVGTMEFSEVCIGAGSEVPNIDKCTDMPTTAMIPDIVDFERMCQDLGTICSCEIRGTLPLLVNGTSGLRLTQNNYCVRGESLTAQQSFMKVTTEVLSIRLRRN